jgi:hypothetical protein
VLAQGNLGGPVPSAVRAQQVQEGLGRERGREEGGWEGGREVESGKRGEGGAKVRGSARGGERRGEEETAQKVQEWRRLRRRMKILWVPGKPKRALTST